MTKPKSEHFISFSIEEKLWENAELAAAHPRSFAFIASLAAIHVQDMTRVISLRKVEKSAKRIFGRKWRLHLEAIIETGHVQKFTDSTVFVPSVISDKKLKHWRDEDPQQHTDTKHHTEHTQKKTSPHMGSHTQATHLTAHNRISTPTTQEETPKLNDARNMTTPSKSHPAQTHPPQTDLGEEVEARRYQSGLGGKPTPVEKVSIQKQLQNHPARKTQTSDDVEEGEVGKTEKGTKRVETEKTTLTPTQRSNTNTSTTATPFSPSPSTSKQRMRPLSPNTTPVWFRGEKFINKAGHEMSKYEEKGKRYCHTCQELIPLEETTYHGTYDYNYVSSMWEPEPEPPETLQKAPVRRKRKTHPTTPKPEKNPPEAVKTRKRRVGEVE